MRVLDEQLYHQGEAEALHAPALELGLEPAVDRAADCCGDVSWRTRAMPKLDVDVTTARWATNAKPACTSP